MSNIWIVELDLIAAWVAIFIIGFGVLQNLLYLSQLGLAARELMIRPPLTRSATLWQRYGKVAPPIAVIVPAFNEELSIVENVRSLLALQYPSFEVIVVNDGSTDATVKRMIEAFELTSAERRYGAALPHREVRALYTTPRFPRLVVVDKENGGKADALNTGINVARSPLFCCIDADSILEADALLRAVRPFIEDPERVVAVGGTVRIANGCQVASGRVNSVGLPRNLLALLQVVEYLRGFLMARLGWSRLQALMIISGAFGIFSRRLVIAVGGYSHDTVGEDLELVVKLHRYMRTNEREYRVEFISEPVCWTEVPETFRSLARQRSRWHRGALETLTKHRDMLLRPKYGRIGMIGFGHMLVVDLLGPIVEVLGYLLVPSLWALGLLELNYMLAFLAVTFTFGVFISVSALILEEMAGRRFPKAWHLIVLTVAAVLENFGYRQLTNLWRIRGHWQYLRGTKLWGDMGRVGFANH